MVIEMKPLDSQAVAELRGRSKALGDVARVLRNAVMTGCTAAEALEEIGHWLTTQSLAIAKQTDQWKGQLQEDLNTLKGSMKL